MKITKDNIHKVLNRVVYISLAIIALFWAATFLEERSSSGEITVFGTFTVFVTLFGVGAIIMSLIIKLVFYFLFKE